ncbi:MAG: nitroreductase family protein [Aristaeellaceae bacterium]
MTIMEAIENRHSVRSYQDKAIPADIVAALEKEIAACNAEGDLHIQLVTNEKDAFAGFMAHYGKFSGVQNYIALIGKKSADLDEKLGYYGERIVLAAQRLGLNTCWVAMTMRKGVVKKNCTIGRDEKLVCVLSLGYGTTQGVAHKSKAMDALCDVSQKPVWFVQGMEAALLAPTAMNQQKFLFSLDGNKVIAKSTGGFYSKVDLGIVKYHFEIGAGKDNFSWS